MLSSDHETHRCGEQTYGLDIAMHHACETLQAHIRLAKKGGRELDKSVSNSMQWLFCAGVAICVDTCGVPPEPQGPDGTGGLYTDAGLAAAYADTAQESRHESAHKHGLGVVFSRNAIQRTSSRGRGSGRLACAVAGPQSAIALVALTRADFMYE